MIPTEEFFPHMAQAIAASDQIIKDKPELVRKFVKAALHGMKDIMDDPDKAAVEFVSFVPEWKGKEGGVKYAFDMYAKSVYPGQKELGRGRSGAARQAAGFLSGQGLHPEGDAGRRALHQSVHQVARHAVAPERQARPCAGHPRRYPRCRWTVDGWTVRLTAIERMTRYFLL